MLILLSTASELVRVSLGRIFYAALRTNLNEGIKLAAELAERR
jgi:hypothetical protein